MRSPDRPSPDTPSGARSGTHRSAVDVSLWALSGISLVAIVLLSVTSQPPAGPFSVGDKLQHAVAYAVLTGATLLAAVWRPRRGNGIFPQGALRIATAALALGILLEIVQATGPFPGREGDPRDAMAGGVGIAAALLVWLRVRRRFVIRERAAT